ncbi:MAG: AMP-binding protein, partial [bacterium]|nr:AMP-binding protein [bacterium]
VGVTGELCIAGDGLARGYLNKPELTAERFTKTAWQYAVGNKKEKTPITNNYLYRTGDLACWLTDGNIEFLGRIDHQVKIRGFRIELGEIETGLLKHPGIKEAVVLARESKESGHFLCAYYVAESTQQPASGIQAFLSQYLPHYMIPSFLMELEKIPLTTNGKIDRKALPAPEIKTTRDYEAPTTRVEKALAAEWRQILNTGKLGINDNYFSLGGDSIKTIQIASRLRKYDLKLEVKDIFTHQTIKQLAPHVKKISRKSLQGTVEGTVPLTPIQQWFFRSPFTENNHFNQAVMIYREKGFDETILKKTFSKIVRHHDALRMVFESRTKKDVPGTKDKKITDTTVTHSENSDGNSAETAIVQRNRGIEGELFHLEVFDFKNQPEEKIKTKIPIEATRIQAGINLKTGPLLKLGLFKTTT